MDYYRLVVAHVRPLADVPALLVGCTDATVAAELALAGETRRQRADLAHAVLECVDAHLWTKRNPHMLPQAAAVARVETSDHCESLAPFVAADGASLSSAFDYSGTTAHSFDDLATHWGVHVTIHASACPLCMLPLAGATGALKVFRCGHAVHAECCTEDACVRCFTLRFRSLADLAATATPSNEFKGV